MILPEIQDTNDSISLINNFGGVKVGLVVGDGQFSDMSNMTNDYAPALGNRRKRAIIGQLENPQGVLGGKYFCFVDSDMLYVDELHVCDLPLKDVERKMVSIGAYIAVFPDCILYNTVDGTVENMNAEAVSGDSPTFTLCRLDGTNYDENNTYTGDTAPADTSKYWIDTSANPVVIKMYSNNSSQWVSIGTTYVKIESAGIGSPFSKYDAADISGVDEDAPVYNNWKINGSNIIYDAGEDFIVIAGLIDKRFINSKPITVSRKAPEMDFVCEMGNRIYGCSSANHEIYACKLGDPKNWRAYMGLDSDSYAATVGTQSDFTGAITYGGSVYFFKDDGYHRVYGTKPSNFEVVWKPCRGVQQGSEKSLVIFNDYLTWKSREGIILFDGSTNLISADLGSEPLYDAVSGSYRDKLYVSMRDNDYNYRCYVYDINKHTWCIEDGYRYKYIVYANGGMYAINGENIIYVINNEKVMKKLFPSKDLYPDKDLYPKYIISGDVEDRFEWFFETGDMGITEPFQKYIKRIDLRFSLNVDAYVKIEVMYDDDDIWQEFARYYCTRKRSYSVAAPVARCDHLRLRFSGQGDFRLYSIARVMETGSDV